MSTECILRVVYSLGLIHYFNTMPPSFYHELALDIKVRVLKEFILEQLHG